MLLLISIILLYRRRVLTISKGIDEVGNINWEILLCLIAMWIVCYFSVWKGVKSTGKVSVCLATQISLLPLKPHQFLNSFVLLCTS